MCNPSATGAPSVPCVNSRVSRGALRCPDGRTGARKGKASSFGAAPEPCSSCRATRGAWRCPQGHARVRKCNTFWCYAVTFGRPKRPAVCARSRRRAEVHSEELLRCHLLVFGLPEARCGALKGTQAHKSAIRALSALRRCHAVAFGIPEAPCGVLEGAQARSSATRAFPAPLRSHAVAPWLPQGAMRCHQGHAGARKCNTNAFGVSSLPCGSLRTSCAALSEGHAGARKAIPIAFGDPPMPCGSRTTQAACGAVKSTQARGRSFRAPVALLRCHEVSCGLPGPCDDLKANQARGSPFRAPSCRVTAP